MARPLPGPSPKHTAIQFVAAGTGTRATLPPLYARSERGALSRIRRRFVRLRSPASIGPLWSRKSLNWSRPDLCVARTSQVPPIAEHPYSDGYSFGFGASLGSNQYDSSQTLAWC